MKTHRLPRCPKLLAVFVLASCFRWEAAGQVVMRHDASGNLTNALASSTNSPLVTAKTTNQTLLLGEGLSLSASVVGSGPITYQWRINGSNISGATNAVLYRANAAAADAGTYSVVVSNGSGTVTNQLGDITILASSNSLYGVAFGAGCYVAVGERGTVVKSTDLIAWSVVTTPTTNRLDGITFGNNQFVAVGERGTILLSANGTSWQVATSGTTNDLRGVVYASGLYAAVGAGGTVLSSTNAASWTTRTFDNPRLEAVTYGAGQFVAVGTGGTIWTSANGTAWSDRSWPTNQTLKGVTFGNGSFTAVGTAGLILSSPDSVSWTPRASGTRQSFEAVLFFNGMHCALGAIGRNYVSTSGALWDDSDAGTYEQLYAATLGNGVPVAVGKNGLILRIPYSLVDHFEWSLVDSPQRVNTSFTATVVAKDAANNTVSTFGGSISLSASVTQALTTNTILGNVTHSGYLAGTFTSGYSFTPNADILVTQVRHYAGKRVYILRDNFEPLLGLDVPTASGSWITTPLPVPLKLSGGSSYIVWVYSETGVYYRGDGTATFADGTINQAFIQDPALRPTNVRWFLVDVGYVLQRPGVASVSPTTVTMAGGTASVNLSVATAGDSVTLRADDLAGHVGVSSGFSVLATNDLQLTLSANPSPATVGTSLSFTTIIRNSGPGSATGVYVTNVVPTGATYVSATSSQGTCQYSNGRVVCNIGTVAALANVTNTIVVTPTSAGALLLDVANVIRSEADANSTNNQASVVVYVPPVVTVGNIAVYEGNVGVGYAAFPVTLSSPSSLAVSFDYSTADGAALAGSDYVATKGTATIQPGGSTATVWVGIQGDTSIETDEPFMLNLAAVRNATLSSTQAVCTIVNDDGRSKELYRFVWDPIYTPARVDSPISARITAVDAAGATATNFLGSVVIRGVNVGGTTSRVMQTNEVHSASDNIGSFTLGYSFTPTNDIFITHVRHYMGTKVTVWNDAGLALATVPVVSVAGEWSETQLGSPVMLAANSTYRVGVFTAGTSYYWRDDAPPAFQDGPIGQAFSGTGDTFPAQPDPMHWYMVGLRYTPPASITPTNTGVFAAGVWSGSITVQEPGSWMLLQANDQNGHTGFSSPFGTYQSDDLALDLFSSTTTPVVGSNLTFTVNVYNPGPTTSTSVKITNNLPANVSLVSVSTTKGTLSTNGTMLICDLGSLTGLQGASVTIVLSPTVAGYPLTNTATVARAELDNNLTNNSRTLILTPSLALAGLLAEGADFNGSRWRSGGSALWGSQASVTHDGADALASGGITHSQQTWAETTLRGPGILVFWWRVSSQTNADFLTLYTNGVSAGSLTGESGWVQKTVNVPAGPFVVRWTYSKDGSISSGTDAGWLDQVSYAVPPFFFSAVSFSNAQLRTTLNATNGQRLVLQESSELIKWSSFATNTMTGTSANFIITPPSNAPWRLYRAVHLNE